MPSAILNVQKEHTTDKDVFATSTILVQSLHLHCNFFVDFSFFMILLLFFLVGKMVEIHPRNVILHYHFGL